jgi:hypothetical protein
MRPPRATGLSPPTACCHPQVELANMNRLFFRPEQCGMTKTDAAAQTLSELAASQFIPLRPWHNSAQNPTCLIPLAPLPPCRRHQP